MMLIRRCRSKTLRLGVWAKYNDFLVVLVHFCAEAVLEIANVRYNVLNQPFALDGNVILFVDGKWMTIVSSPSMETTSDFR